MRAKRVLVTGASSPLGLAVGRHLQKSGHVALGTVRRDTNTATLTMFDELSILDLSHSIVDTYLVKSLDAIIHVAAESYGTPAQMMTTNAVGTFRLASAAIARGVARFVYVSSTSVYGSAPTSELCSTSPISYQSAYGVSKWGGESYLHSLRDQISCVSVRSPAIVGTQSNPHFLQRVRNSMQSDEPIIAASHPDFLFNNVIHEDTLAEFLVRLALTHSDGFKAFPVGSLQDVTLLELLSFMSEAACYGGQVVWSEAADRPFSINLDDAIKLGLEPLTALETIRRWTLAWNRTSK